MMLLTCFAISLGLFMLFPKGFKYMVGTWIGFSVAFVCWAIATLLEPTLFGLLPLCAFVAAGIIAGCFVAAKG